MHNITSAIKDTVSISLFNRGLAGKIFEEVKNNGAKVVIKNNTAECVLLSPNEYMSIINELNDVKLLAIASERLSNFNPDNLIPSETVYKKFGIDSNNLSDNDEVEFEWIGT